MPEPLVAADIHLSLDILGNLAAQVALDRVGFLDGIAETGHFIVGKVSDTTIGVDFGFFQYLVRCRSTDSEDVRQRDFDALVARKIDSYDAGQIRTPYPCLCLWRGFSHLTLKTPFRRMTLHFEQIGLTDARTFISGTPLLKAIGDPTSREVVRRQLESHFVSRQYFDVMHSHLAGNVRKNLVPIFELNAKHSIGQRFQYRSLYLDNVFFGQKHLLKVRGSFGSGQNDRPFPQYGDRVLEVR